MNEREKPFQQGRNHSGGKEYSVSNSMMNTVQNHGDDKIAQNPSFMRQVDFTDDPTR